MTGKSVAALGLSVVATCALGTAGQQSEDAAAAKRKAVRLNVASPRADAATDRSSIVVRGRATAGARVTVAGKRARLRNARFRVRVALEVGTNRIRVVARKTGHRTVRKTIVVRRTAACDPNYEGACLNPDSRDYDCAGGSGDGPDYTGPVRVVGEDRFDLDRDGDGLGCE